TVVLWVRSFWIFELLSHWSVKSDEVTATACCIWSEQGSCGLNLTVATDHETWMRAHSAAQSGWTREISSRPMVRTRHGFRFELDVPSGNLPVRSTVICVPHWLPTLVLATIPSWWMLRERRRRAALRAV